MTRKHLRLRDIVVGVFVLISVLSTLGGLCRAEAPLREESEPSRHAAAIGTTSGRSSVLATWHAWCKQEQQPESEREPPLCAMYLVKGYGELLVEAQQDEQKTGTSEDVSLSSTANLKSDARGWKRIELIAAVWLDGKLLRRDDSRGRSVAKKGQIESFMRSVQELDFVRKPLLVNRQIYVDVRYWVVEINSGPSVLHLERWNLHPGLDDENPRLQRFVAAWTCAVSWLEQLEVERVRFCPHSRQTTIACRKCKSPLRLLRFRRCCR
jgi:hypothetical protein